MDIEYNKQKKGINFENESDEYLLNVLVDATILIRNRGLQLPATVGYIGLKPYIAIQSDEKKNDALALHDSKEIIEKQMDIAYAAYVQAINIINEGHTVNKRRQILDYATLVQEFQTWFSDDILAYIDNTTDTDPDLSYTLVATPNILTSPIDIANLAAALGKVHKYPTNIWLELINQYTAKQLSGANPANGLNAMFSLIPNKVNYDFYGSIIEKREILEDLQLSQPTVKPISILEALSYWQTLLAHQAKLSDKDSHNLTIIHHFDLPSRSINGFDRVPFSVVSDAGGAISGAYVDRNVGATRISVK